MWTQTLQVRYGANKCDVQIQRHPAMQRREEYSDLQTCDSNNLAITPCAWITALPVTRPFNSYRESWWLQPITFKFSLLKNYQHSNTTNQFCSSIGAHQQAVLQNYLLLLQFAQVGDKTLDSYLFACVTLTPHHTKNPRVLNSQTFSFQRGQIIPTKIMVHLHSSKNRMAPSLRLRKTSAFLLIPLLESRCDDHLCPEAEQEPLGSHWRPANNCFRKILVPQSTAWRFGPKLESSNR